MDKNTTNQNTSNPKQNNLRDLKARNLVNFQNPVFQNPTFEDCKVATPGQFSSTSRNSHTLVHQQHSHHQHSHHHHPLHQRPHITRDVSKIPIAQQTYAEHQEYLRLYSGTRGIKLRTSRLKYLDSLRKNNQAERRSSSSNLRRSSSREDFGRIDVRNPEFRSESRAELFQGSSEIFKPEFKSEFKSESKSESKSAFKSENNVSESLIHDENGDKKELNQTDNFETEIMNMNPYKATQEFYTQQKLMHKTGQPMKLSAYTANMFKDYPIYMDETDPEKIYKWLFPDEEAVVKI